MTEMNYERAVIGYQRVLEIDPMNVDAIFGLADAYIGMGDMEKAIEILRDGLERTGDERIREKLDELTKAEEPPVSSELEESSSESEGSKNRRFHQNRRNLPVNRQCSPKWFLLNLNGMKKIRAENYRI